MNQNTTPSRDLYAELALAYVPHLAQLVDGNSFSPTYGCFDREYWHYRTLDFPCGMSQEFVLPFALLYANEYPGNKYRGWERVRELAVAGIEFAVKGSHKDGTCDDYFPFEQAMGALVFSTYACTEAYRLLGLEDERLLDFFRRRIDHLAKHNESGRLSNHQALAALAAYNVFELTGDDVYRRVAEDRAALTLSWQHPEEGWFQEYEGADPGYHTCTIDFLAKLHQKSGDDALLGPLLKAVDFAWYFMHPDGSYGGEYGSRNTYHFYPHGFELLAPHSVKAGQIADQFLRGAAAGKRYYNEDDRMCCHLVYNWLQAFADYHPERPARLNEREKSVTWLPDAGLAVVYAKGYYAVAGLKKGGVVKAFDEGGCLGSDTGLIGELDDGRAIVSHLQDEEHNVTAEPEKGAFSVEGAFAYRPTKLSSPFKVIVFRALNLTLGRFFPNMLRSLIQKMLITGKERTAYRFRRTLEFGENSIRIRDELLDPAPLKRLAAGCDATSIYVANSNVYQESRLRIPWQSAPEELVRQLRINPGVWERHIPPTQDTKPVKQLHK